MTGDNAARQIESEREEEGPRLEEAAGARFDILAVLTAVFLWLFNRAPEQRPTEPALVLSRSFHLTAKCRYNASIRLKRLGSFSFLTATVLSLGLILIPLFQLASIRLAYPVAVLNMLEIFLAVAVLVFSVVNSTAHYETRSEALNECADRIKALHRELRTLVSEDKGKDAITSMNQRYADINSDSENHSRGDYWLALLQADDICHKTGLPRLWLHIKATGSSLFAYVIPVTLMALEVIIVLDVLGVTQIMTPYFAALAK